MSKTELSVIVARDAPTAVIFRRGPSKKVLLVKWNLEDDTFEVGQWLKGRIYEDSCDLSPSGKFLIYFAANFRFGAGPGTWTAISRPPYLTALAMWPKGNTWDGGGVFESENSVILNHKTSEFTLAEGFKLPKNMKVRLVGFRENIHSFTPLRSYKKKITRGRHSFILASERGGVEKDDFWGVKSHEVLDETRKSVLKLPRTNWADWDRNGDLLYAQKGKLFRLSWTTEQTLDHAKARELVDLTDLKFTPVAAPPEALSWQTL